MFCAILVVVALLYMFWDVNYFIRILVTIGFGRLFDKKCKLNDATTIYGKLFYLIFSNSDSGYYIICKLCGTIKL